MLRPPLSIVRYVAVVSLLFTSAVHAGEEFSVLHLSDVHVSPHLAGTPRPSEVRGQSTFEWLIPNVGKPQNVAGWDESVPVPDFAVVTGDITEYGVIDDTWQIVEDTLGKLPFPWCAVPGNHDNTWVAMYHIMRRRHGGANYSIDHKGCHFVVISSASPQEPVPTIDATTRKWLADDLKKIPTDMPVFIALHHPPEINEFANPAELVTLVDMLRDYNVQLLMFGHGHSVRRHSSGGIPGVQGGSTFGGNSGYGVLSIKDDRVRYAYHFMSKKLSKKVDAPAGGWRIVYDEPMQRQARRLKLTAPNSDSPIQGDRLDVSVTYLAPTDAKPAKLTYALDELPQSEAITADPSESVALKVPIKDLVPGAHLLTVRVFEESPAKSETKRGKRRRNKQENLKSPSDIRTHIFHVADSHGEIVWRKQLSAAVKAGPLLLDDLLVTPTTAGSILAIDCKNGRERWVYPTGGEILASPVHSGERIIFGSGDGCVYAIDRNGKPQWKRDLGIPVYGTPLVDGDVVYIGDNQGRLHALRTKDGEPVWTFERADYAIESAPVIWGDRLVFGAWDGFLYCLDRADGKLIWKKPGPKSSLGKGVRYYAPADCSPVVIGDKLVVCDRGYHLGSYDRDGNLRANGDASVAGISVPRDGTALFARHTNDRVSRIDPDGKVVWDAALPAGRFPIPPTIHGDRVYVCSNTGLLSVLDAATGKTIWTYQTTAGFYVMASVAVAENGVCYVAGMDGTLIALRPPLAKP